MCSGSEAGSYLRLIDCVYLSTLCLRVIKKKKKKVFASRQSARPRQRHVRLLQGTAERLYVLYKYFRAPTRIVFFFREPMRIVNGLSMLAGVLPRGACEARALAVRGGGQLPFLGSVECA